MNVVINDVDREFAQNLRILSKVATTNHPWAKYFISRYVEMYIHKKINMELANSFSKVFR